MEAAEINKKVGSILRASRLAIGKSLDEVSARVGVSLQQVQKYETGKHSLTIPRAIAFCKALKLRLGDLEPRDGPGIEALESMPIALAKNFQRLSEEGQAAVVSLVRSLIKAEGKHGKNN